MAKKSLNGDKVLGALADLSEAVGGGFEKVHKEFAAAEAIILKDHERRLEALERKVGASHR